MDAKGANDGAEMAATTPSKQPPKPNQAGGEEEKTPTAPASASKMRLLPMELRRRRRAAKLQVARSNDAGTAVSVATPSKNDPVADTGAVEEKTTMDLPPPTAAAEGDSYGKDKKDVEIAEASTVANETQPVPPVSKPTHWLTSLSNADRKRQKRHHRAQWHLPTTFHVDQVPVDIGPKSKLIILTALPFPFARSKRAVVDNAINAVMARGLKIQSESKTLEQQWHEALHYFVHPASALPAGLLTAPGAQLQNTKRVAVQPEFLVRRLRTWQEAFQHAYFGRAKSTPTGDKQSTALGSSLHDVCHEHIEETQEQGDNADEVGSQQSARLCAVMTPSNARTRKRLHELNIPFATPFNANALQREVGDFRLLEEEIAISKSQDRATAPKAATSSGMTSANVHGQDSLLRFDGHLAVHGLYEFLVNHKPQSNQDVPEIVTLHPFKHSSIQSLKVESFGRVAMPVAAGTAQDGEVDNDNYCFRTELSGVCFPSTLQSVVDLIRRELGPEHERRRQQSDMVCRVVVETLTNAERVNALFLAREFADPQRAVIKTFEEREKVKQHLECAKRRIQTITLRTAASWYEIETTSK